MNAERQLEGIKILAGRIHRMRDNLEVLRKNSADVRSMGQTSMSDTMAGKRLAELEAKTTTDITRLELLMERTVQLIHALDDKQAEELLYLRYVCSLDYYEISERMSYSLGMLHRIRRRALQELEQRLGPETS